MAVMGGSALGESVMGTLYEDDDGVAKNVVYAVLWFRRVAADGNSYASSQLARFHIPATPPVPASESPGWSSANGDFLPYYTSSACAAHGGYGDDSYCFKDGQQIDPNTGEALALNAPGYIDTDDVEQSDEVDVPTDTGNSESYDSDGGGDSGYVGGGDDGGGDDD